MARLSTIKPTAVHKSVLYCPTCKIPLDQPDGGYICQRCSKVFPIIDGIPSLVVQQGVIDSFDASAFEFLFKMEQKHFWHVPKEGYTECPYAECAQQGK